MTLGPSRLCCFHPHDLGGLQVCKRPSPVSKEVQLSRREARGLGQFRWGNGVRGRSSTHWTGHPLHRDNNDNSNPSETRALRPQAYGSVQCTAEGPGAQTGGPMSAMPRSRGPGGELVWLCLGAVHHLQDEHVSFGSSGNPQCLVQIRGLQFGVCGRRGVHLDGTWCGSATAHSRAGKPDFQFVCIAVHTRNQGCS